MAVVYPFVAWRPPVEFAGAVAALPYDVMDADEARAMAAGNPYSFLHVSRPEIAFPAGTPSDTDAVHRTGSAALQRMRESGWLVPDPQPGLHVYRQSWRSVTQTGVMGLASLDEYASGVVARHEFTRPDKEQDRVHHVDALGAQDEPVFLLCPPSRGLRTALAGVTAAPPQWEIDTGDGVVHSWWPVLDAPTIAALMGAFAAQPRLYIADGHHRSAAALRVRDLRRGRDCGGTGDDGFLAVVFPSDEVRVLAYHRVCELPCSPADFLAALARIGELSTAPGPVEPMSRGSFGVYVAGSWYRLDLTPAGRGHAVGSAQDKPAEAGRGSSDPAADLVASLDVAVLQDQVLGPLLGITEPRTDQRIRFVGGLRGTAELVRLVDGGSEPLVAFALCPTDVEDLMRVAEEGAVMPPKSTWFEPKLRSGFAVHALPGGLGCAPSFD